MDLDLLKKTRDFLNEEIAQIEGSNEVNKEITETQNSTEAERNVRALEDGYSSLANSEYEVLET